MNYSRSRLATVFGRLPDWNRFLENLASALYLSRRSLACDLTNESEATLMPQEKKCSEIQSAALHIRSRVKRFPVLFHSKRT